MIITSNYLHTCLLLSFFFFFFNDTATTEIYTLSLHYALPISVDLHEMGGESQYYFPPAAQPNTPNTTQAQRDWRSEEHTSELQSLAYLVCRLLLEKKKKKIENKKDPQLFHRHDSAARIPTADR